MNLTIRFFSKNQKQQIKIKTLIFTQFYRKPFDKIEKTTSFFNKTTQTLTSYPQKNRVKNQISIKIPENTLKKTPYRQKYHTFN